MTEAGWLFRSPKVSYATLNVAVVVAILVCAPLHGQPLSLGVYAASMFMLCTAPLLYMRRFNDRYALLGIFMVLYFLFFGSVSLVTVLMGSDLPVMPREGLFTSAELAILSGGVLALVGYLVGAGRVTAARARRVKPMREWPEATLLIIGGLVWFAGTASMVYLQIYVVPEKTAVATTRGLAAMGPVVTFMVMLGHLIQPLGLLILAYGYARHRGALWSGIILAVVLVQIASGFVMDVKMQALMGGAIVILVRTLVDNRLPKAWLAGALVFVVVAFPVFQAYRMEITQERGLDRAQALRNIGHVLQVALESREKVTTGRSDERAESFLERSSDKNALENVFAHVGHDVDYLGGITLTAIPLAFVPRLLMPDKEDWSVGMLYTRRILKSTDDTYISISHLGELFWNFGWAGILLGMPLFGLLLGAIGAKVDLSEHMSMTRMLVLLATVQTLCMNFGATMPGSYIVWMRSLAAIGLLHLICARATTKAQGATEASMSVTVVPEPVDGAHTKAAIGSSRGLLPPGAVTTPRFPNLLS